MKYHKLRIAWSVAWVLVCVSVVTLHDVTLKRGWDKTLLFPPYEVTLLSAGGVLKILWKDTTPSPVSPPGRPVFITNRYHETPRLPYWALLALSVVSVAAPWLCHFKWQF